MRTTQLSAILAVTVCTAAAAVTNGPRFYQDDPLWNLPDTQDASATKPWERDVHADGLEHMFALPGGPVTEQPAMAVNTVGEVPDSSWYTNRDRRGPLTPADVARGPNLTQGPTGLLTVVSAKNEGVMPGLVVRDIVGRTWFLKFDPPVHRGMASGAEVISTKLLWALGYNVPENHIAHIHPDALVIDPSATVRTATGKRAMKAADLAAILKRASRDADGSSRVLASLGIEGRPLGPFTFHGVRPDDPNDYIPHEHRRELRGYGTFSAWLNHVDSKSANTLDTLVTHQGRATVKHYLLDFGSTLGSAGIGARERYQGWQYLYNPRELLAGVLTFGLRVQQWRTQPAFVSPAAGALPDSRSWDPDAWRPHFPNPAFLRARSDDRFWAARKLQRLSRESIEAAVASADYGDPATRAAVLAFLLERRAAILRQYLTAVNPVVDPHLDRSGALTFANAAVDEDVADAPVEYRTRWSWFDNATGATTPIGTRTAVSTSVTAPAPLPLEPGRFVRVEISAISRSHPSWQAPVTAYFRAADDRWTLVGLDRMP